jgi:hypothetical protein
VVLLSPKVGTHVPANIYDQTLREISNVKETIKEIENRLKNKVIKLPDYGQVPAGYPCNVEQATDDWFEIPQEYLENRDTGDSLEKDGIFDGDVITLLRQWRIKC